MLQRLCKTRHTLQRPTLNYSEEHKEAYDWTFLAKFEAREATFERVCNTKEKDLSKFISLQASWPFFRYACCAWGERVSNYYYSITPAKRAQRGPSKEPCPNARPNNPAPSLSSNTHVEKRNSKKQKTKNKSQLRPTTTTRHPYGEAFCTLNHLPPCLSCNTHCAGVPAAMVVLIGFPA